MSGQTLSSAADIDPSYLSLIETDGLIPTRPKVLALGRALGCVDAILLHAGYAPDHPPEKVLQCLAGPGLDGLGEPLRSLLLECLRRSPREQAALAELLEVGLRLRPNSASG